MKSYAKFWMSSDHKNQYTELVNSVVPEMALQGRKLDKQHDSDKKQSEASSILESQHFKDTLLFRLPQLICLVWPTYRSSSTRKFASRLSRQPSVVTELEDKVGMRLEFRFIGREP